jgi:3-oxoacyl-[acyl-carrier protein] reductase
MSKLNGKVAIVTGASKGIGAGIAKAFAAEGARVVVSYGADKEGADRVVAEITARDGKAVAVQADVSKEADVKRLFAEAKAAFGKLDVLVNNAGVFNFLPLEQVTAAEFHRQFDTNVLGPLLTTQEALKYFGPEGGNVINISSTAATRPPAGSSVYSSTKGALDTVTRALAGELASRKIRVNTISPGATDTEGARALFAAGGEELLKQLIAQTPLGRLGQPEDIARAAVFIASDDGAWVTGERLPVAGGWY